jgi:hypothetical protein
MTDARFPERWLNDKRVVRLSDAAFRTFVTTMAWSVANRTDGVIEMDDLELIHGADRKAVPMLVERGLWATSKKDVFFITVFKETQTSRHELEVLDNVRRRDREKKARQRSKGSSEDESLGMSPGTTSPGNFPRDCIGEDRKAGQEGQAREVRKLFGVEIAENDDWPAVTAPGIVTVCRECGESVDPVLAEDVHPGCEAAS